MTTALRRPSPGGTLTAQTASKVPEITVWFWVIKVLTTGMGETTSDFVVHRVSPVLAVLVAGAILAGVLVVQLGARRYVPWRYWSAVVMVSVFGTMAADAIHIGLGVPYVASTVGFAVVLAVVFVAWRSTERSLSIHSITTRRRELFYWATVMTTFALGTAAGDMTARTFGLGYFSSGVLFAVAILVPLMSWRLSLMGPVTAFWFAYVVTRPLGASFADWIGVPRARGGLDLGTGSVSLVVLAVVAVLVGVLTVTRVDAPGDALDRPARTRAG